jgi:glycosyltransferase involved in cell wall biosynthesis
VIVGLDLLFLVPGETGGRETHARELLRAIAARPDRPRLVAFLGADAAGAGPGWWSELADDVVVLRRASTRSTARWALGEAVGVRRAAARAGVDVLHGPANFVPRGGPFARVVTLHDVAWRKLPHLMPAPRRWATDALVAPGARNAHRVVTVSAASRDDIVEEYAIPAERIAVVPNGIAPAPVSAGGRGRTILAVATDLPHKNLAGLLEAVALLDDGPPLVIAGARTDSGGLAALARELGVDVRILGAVDTQTLEGLYAEAALYVTATLYEGFGLPVLEAMARGVPVVCSDLPVLREVAGDAAIFTDPRDPAAIAAAIRRGLSDGEALVAAGRERAARFTWEAAAERTVEVYRDAAAAAG